ncbi:putative A-kinase anchor protein [Naja naja]|nr:putative A-kinase anchor protein [Naja naja]
MEFFFLFRPSSSRSPPDHTRTQPSHKKANVKILKNFDEAIIVDAASLDPESLYQRTYAGKMTFGRAQEEMAWRIAKMIVNDVMQQAQPPEAAVDKEFLPMK